MKGNVSVTPTAHSAQVSGQPVQVRMLRVADTPLVRSSKSDVTPNEALQYKRLAGPIPTLMDLSYIKRMKNGRGRGHFRLLSCYMARELIALDEPDAHGHVGLKFIREGPDRGIYAMPGGCRNIQLSLRNAKTEQEIIDIQRTEVLFDVPSIEGALTTGGVLAIGGYFGSWLTLSVCGADAVYLNARGVAKAALLEPI